MVFTLEFESQAKPVELQFVQSAGNPDYFMFHDVSVEEVHGDFFPRKNEVPYMLGGELSCTPNPGALLCGFMQDKYQNRSSFHYFEQNNISPLADCRKPSGDGYEEIAIPKKTLAFWTDMQTALRNGTATPDNLKRVMDQIESVSLEKRV
jgi:hypothetical protein